MLTSYMPEDFFDGLGSYLGGKNMDAAITFIGKKIWRMAEKMGNPDNEHTFDIFEEYLFDKILLWANEELTTLPEVKETYLKLCEMRQRLVEGTLMEKYGYSESRAKEMAETVCRLDKMRPDWETCGMEGAECHEENYDAGRCCKVRYRHQPSVE
ncbi:MAG: hypothetical protein LUG27_02455 [Clostridiales bacterium]|nr:hypothetical protein [Clostridiales bacterium]